MAIMIYWRLGELCNTVWQRGGYNYVDKVYYLLLQWDEVIIVVGDIETEVKRRRVYKILVKRYGGWMGTTTTTTTTSYMVYVVLIT